MALKSFFITLLGGVLLLTFNGCGPASSLTNYQVVSVKSPSLEKKDKGLVYKKDNVTLNYNLWGSQGNLKYQIVNQSNEIMYVDLKRSFFIKDSNAYSYHPNQTTQTKPSLYLNPDKERQQDDTLIVQGLYPSVDRLNEGSEKTDLSSKETIMVPPKSKKTILSFKVKQDIFEFCDLKRDVSRADTAVKNFSMGNTPMTFENYLVYSFDKNFENTSKIRNKFWVEKLTNLDSYNFVVETEKPDPCKDDETIERDVIKEKDKDKFYIKYTEEP